MVPCRKVTGYDPMSSVRQELTAAQHGDTTVLNGVLVRDWPLIIRLAD